MTTSWRFGNVWCMWPLLSVFLHIITWVMPRVYGPICHARLLETHPVHIFLAKRYARKPAVHVD